MVTSLSSGASRTRSYSSGGNVSATSTSPASSAATRALSFGMNRNTTRLPRLLRRPSNPSLRSSTASCDGVQRTNLYGPVPIAARPPFQSAAVASFAAFAETIAIVVR